MGKNLSQLLGTFHSDVAERSELSGAGAAALPMSERQLAKGEQGPDLVQRCQKTKRPGAMRGQPPVCAIHQERHGIRLCQMC